MCEKDLFHHSESYVCLVKGCIWWLVTMNVIVINYTKYCNHNCDVKYVLGCSMRGLIGFNCYLKS